MDGGEGFLDVAGIKSDERILAYFGAVDGFDFDLIDGSLRALLRKARDAQQDHQRQSDC
jgi:hypothetical protein